MDKSIDNSMLGLYIKTKTALASFEEKIFTKQNQRVFFSFLLLFVVAAIVLMPDLAMAGDNPLETMKNIYIDQAQTNAFPVVIIWTLILGVVISFAMGKFMPFILAVIASVVIAITPDIAPNFTYDNLQAQ